MIPSTNRRDEQHKIQAATLLRVFSCSVYSEDIGNDISPILQDGYRLREDVSCHLTIRVLPNQLPAGFHSSRVSKI